MTSLERMLSILDLFNSDRMEWTVEALSSRLQTTRSTTYRYLKTLCDAGLLTSLPGVGYTLGPRVVELDFLTRTHDPLIGAGRPVMAELAAEVPGVALLCRRYRDRVLCVHQERGPVNFVSNYERGLARPLTRGAASRIILACMPAPALRRLYQARASEFAAAGLGNGLAEVRARLRAVRQAGIDITTGDVTAGVTGIAAPVFDRRGDVLGSLSVTVAQGQAQGERGPAIAEKVKFCAAILTRAVSGTEDV